jgi:twitching motility protein PilT
MDLEHVLRRAVELGASDVHFKVERPPIVRRDGTLGELEGAEEMTDRDLELILDQVCAETPKRLQTFLETGELDSAYSPSGLPRFRVNGFRQRGSISVAFRVIPREVPGFEELSLPPGVRRLAEEHRGLILCTGATGAGKTTTLAAIIDHINRSRRQHIVTIEDPIEIVHGDHSCIVNQREVGLDTASFGQALRRGLRQDPDVILIGELRDAETAETALHAAESGHLVLSTMHTVDASETIGRMTEFFPSSKQPLIRTILAGVLRGVVSQRLLPKIGGGRVPAVEVMIGNARIADLIRENKPDEIVHAIEEGEFFQMQTFSDALIRLVLDGKVDREVAANSASNRHDFLIALERALKEHALAAPPEAHPDPEPETAPAEQFKEHALAAPPQVHLDPKPEATPAEQFEPASEAKAEPSDGAQHAAEGGGEATQSGLDEMPRLRVAGQK